MLTKWKNLAKGKLKGKLKEMILTQRRAQNSVHFSDTTLRDGEQMPGAALTTDGKVAIAKGLAELGIDSLDAGFPAAAESEILAIRRIVREVKGPVITGLCRTIEGDIDAAYEARSRSVNAGKAYASHGLGDPVTLLEHDLFELKADTFHFSPYPLVTAIDLFHGYYFEGRERLLELFRAMRSTFQTQRFLVSEMYLADEDTMRRIAYPMIEHELFHGLTGQRTFREGELEGLLEEAGFTIRERWPMRNLAARIFLLFD